MRVLRSIASGFLLVATSCATTAEFGYSSGPGYYDGYYDYGGYPYDAYYAGYPYDPYAAYYPYTGNYPYAGYYPYSTNLYHGPAYAPGPQRNVTIARPPQYTPPPATAPPSAAPRTPSGSPSTTIARPPGR